MLGFRLTLLISLGIAYAQTPETSLSHVQSLIDSGDFSGAETATRRYLADHPESADAHYLLGYILFKQDDPKSSLAEYSAGGRLRTPSALELEVIGCDYFLLEDYATADKWLTESVQHNPRDPLALYFLGRTKYNEQRFEEAVHWLNQSLKSDSTNVKAQEYLGLSYARLGNSQDAITAYLAAIALDRAASGHIAGPYLDLGALLVDTARPADAVPYLLEAIQIGNRDAQVHRELGKAYLLSNELVKAQTELEQALSLDPQNASVHFLLAQVYKKRGLADKARTESDRYAALTRGHSSRDDPLAEARSLLENGELNNAEQLTRQYLTVHKNSAEAHFLLGYILFKEEKGKDSLAEYTEGAKYRTPSAHDLEVVGGDYVLLKDYGDADKWFTKSVEWDPTNFQTLYYLGRTKYNENRFDEAIDIFTRCLKLDSRNVKAEDNLGLSYEGLGRMEDAITAYRTSISWQSDSKLKDSGPYIDLGNILIENGRPSEAVPYLVEALQISPQDLRAHRALGKAYLHLNQLEKAQAEFEKCVQLAPESAPTHFMLAQVYRKRGLLAKAELETRRYAALSGTHSSTESPQ